MQGHWWTTSANVTDWIEKAWRLNYSNRNRGSDFLAPVAEPERCSLFQSALAKQNQSGGSFTLRNYGDLSTAPSGYRVSANTSRTVSCQYIPNRKWLQCP